MVAHDFVNKNRTPRERRVRYCYLRQIGCNRELTRSIVGRRDKRIAESVDNLHKSGII